MNENSAGEGPARDTKSKSATEALVNAFGGYPIGYGIGIILLPASVGWLQEDPVTANAAITVAYTVASFLRLYLLRRVFERFGFDDNVIRLSARLYRRLKRR
jgi:hypothetical protein